MARAGAHPEAAIAFAVNWWVNGEFKVSMILPAINSDVAELFHTRTVATGRPAKPLARWQLCCRLSRLPSGGGGGGPPDLPRLAISHFVDTSVFGREGWGTHLCQCRAERCEGAIAAQSGRMARLKDLEGVCGARRRERWR